MEVMEVVTAIRVRLVDWHDSSKSAEVVASTFRLNAATALDGGRYNEAVLLRRPKWTSSGD